MPNKVAPYRDPKIIDQVTRFYDVATNRRRRQRGILPADHASPQDLYRDYLYHQADSPLHYHETLNLPQFEKVLEVVRAVRGVITS